MYIKYGTNWLHLHGSVLFLCGFPDKRAAEQLSDQVNEACLLLAEYNQRLTSELEERKKVAFLLRGFVNQVKAQMQDTERQLDVSSR